MEDYIEIMDDYLVEIIRPGGDYLEIIRLGGDYLEIIRRGRRLSQDNPAGAAIIWR